MFSKNAQLGSPPLSKNPGYTLHFSGLWPWSRYNFNHDIKTKEERDWKQKWPRITICVAPGFTRGCLLQRGKKTQPGWKRLRRQTIVLLSVYITKLLSTVFCKLLVIVHSKWAFPVNSRNTHKHIQHLRISFLCLLTAKTASDTIYTTSRSWLPG